MKMLLLGRQRRFTYQIRSREYELNIQKKALGLLSLFTQQQMHSCWTHTIQGAICLKQKSGSKKYITSITAHARNQYWSWRDVEFLYAQEKSLIHAKA